VIKAAKADLYKWWILSPALNCRCTPHDRGETQEVHLTTVKLPNDLPRPEPGLSRVQAAAYLTEIGFPTAPSRLAKFAVSGGGPAYRKWGLSTVYLPSDLVAWAQTRAGTPKTHTSQSAA
jgi:hypothetical protein